MREGHSGGQEDDADDERQSVDRHQAEHLGLERDGGEEARLQAFHGNDIVLPAGAAAAAIVPGELDRAGGVVRAQGEVEAIRAGHAGGTRWRTTK